MRELSKIVSKDSEMNDDFWIEICNIDFTKIEFFPVRSLLAGILKINKIIQVFQIYIIIW